MSGSTARWDFDGRSAKSGGIGERKYWGRPARLLVQYSQVLDHLVGGPGAVDGDRVLSFSPHAWPHLDRFRVGRLGDVVAVSDRELVVIIFRLTAVVGYWSTHHRSAEWWVTVLLDMSVGTHRAAWNGDQYTAGPARTCMVRVDSSKMPAQRVVQ